MNQNSSGFERDLTDNDHAFDLMQRGLTISDQNPSQALELLEQSASQWLRQDDKRRAAFVLHQRASLSLKNKQSPIKDLAMAARLLKNEPEARAVVLLDLGQALTEEKEFRKAALALRESEKLARRANNVELSRAARYALGDVSVGGGRRKKVTVKSEAAHPKVMPPEVTPPEVTPPEVTPSEVTPPQVTPPEVTPSEVTPPEVSSSKRSHDTGFTMIYEVENDLLTTLHQIGSLSDDPLAKWERERRAQAVEDELAALKRQMGM